MDELDQTQDFSSSENNESNSHNVSFAPIGKYESQLSNLSGLFEESNRLVLQSRLLVATATTLVFLLVLKIFSLVVNAFLWNDLLPRLTSVFVLASVLVTLVKRSRLRLSILRTLAIVVFAVPVAEALIVLVHEVNKLVSNGSADAISTAFALFSFAIGVLIAIYGMYLSVNWKQTLLVTAVAAISPTVVALIHQFYIDVPINKYPGLFAPIMTLALAAVATTAARGVQIVRREAVEAKQYGQYHLDKKIGEGGMGVVYKANHRMLKRPAAVKLIRAEVAAKPESATEFEHEVQLSASLTHWNTVQIFDYGRTDDGEFYYVMEYLEGLTLEQRIRGGKLSPQEMVHVVSQICDGLSEAHGVGMIHRDLKPANIMLTEIGAQKDVVKILDFGLAAMKTEASRLEKIGGTPAYMSPEQIEGKNVDNRSDIYALGLIIYECLAGQRLMIADSVGELLNLQLYKIPSLHLLPDTDSDFSSVINTCLEKDRRNRFDNVASLKKALHSSLK